ncbi:MYC [Bugula neritina]|uniref:MYC n=1 Tax=Bugula neritina TaxID=10212 RepID=A0A7J7IWN9_BUGNE|nr:MYC [Bugula neritina]
MLCYNLDSSMEMPLTANFLCEDMSPITPPLSPERDFMDLPSLEQELYDNIQQFRDVKNNIAINGCSPTHDLEYYSDSVVLRDCMWSGKGYKEFDESRPKRQRNDSLKSEEDVIDVVTVDTRTSVASPAKTKVYNKRAALFELNNNLCAVAQKLTNCKRSSSDHDFYPSKKSKRVLSSHNSVMSSLNNSDSEEYEGKRSAHNVMERHRRNELKNSLHDLRDSLPSLESRERTPKVLILEHATEYIMQLRGTERSLFHELSLESRERTRPILRGTERSLFHELSKVKARNTKLKERLAELMEMKVQQELCEDDSFY